MHTSYEASATKDNIAKGSGVVAEGVGSDFSYD